MVGQAGYIMTVFFLSVGSTGFILEVENKLHPEIQAAGETQLGVSCCHAVHAESLITH